MRRRYWMVPMVVVALCAAVAAADWFVALPEGLEKKYVGRESCLRCHQAEYEKWTGSDHDLAMDLATEETVLADFDDAAMEYHGVTSRMFRRDGKFLVTTDGPDGKLDTFEVKYVFGYRPLQQYMVEFPDGRVQVLPMCWDVEQKRWFHIYENDATPVTHDEWVHWTKAGQTWNYMCADCHSTNLRKNYDLETDTYHTTFSEIDVSCEACHGPGSIHVELAESRSLFWDRNYGYGLAKLKGEDTSGELEACAKCHSRRRVVAGGFHAGDRYLDHYATQLLDENLYHADGQILEEVYVHGSFQQSLMSQKGVRCTDCHDPHTTRLKFSGNKLCAQCHTPEKYDTPAHHHHNMGGSGASCVECHMPETTYMVVDPRRDHSIRPPRPDLSVLLDTPNSCTGCHLEREGKLGEGPGKLARDYAHALEKARNGDEAVEAELDRLDRWADDWTLQWYGQRRRTKPHYALALAAGQRGELEPGVEAKGDPEAEQEEIVHRLARLSRLRNEPPIVRASAASYLSRYPGRDARLANEELLDDPDPQVRLAAVSNLESFHGLRPQDVASFGNAPPTVQRELESRLKRTIDGAAPLLDDPVRAVRVEAARVLSIVPPGMLTAEQRKQFDAALEEFKAGQLELADQGAAHVTLGAVYENLQDTEAAEAAYRQALELEPRLIPPRFNLARLLNARGENEEAERLLREAIDELKQATARAEGPAEAEPAEFLLGQGYYDLGLLLAEDVERLSEAAEMLERAAELSPEAPRIRYNYGLALRQLERWEDAAGELEAAHELAPEDVDVVHALVHLYRQRRQWPKALQHAETLLRLAPRNSGAQQMYQEIKRQSEAPARVGPQPQ